MTDKREQPLYFPESMLMEIQDHAVRTDRSLSNIVQTAWKAAAAKISALDDAAIRALPRTYVSDTKRKQSLFFPVDMLDAITAEAGRIDASVSTIVQAAFVLAKDAIAALPDATGFVVED